MQWQYTYQGERNGKWGWVGGEARNVKKSVYFKIY